jgi:hypothetical protein
MWHIFKEIICKLYNEMNNSARLTFLAIVSIALMAHFTFLSLEAFRPSPLSFSYTYPFFQQNWKLFVPAPHSDYQLFCIYEKEGKIIKKDLIMEKLTAHKENPFSGTEPILNTLLASVHFYEHNPTDVNYKILEYGVSKILTLENGTIHQLKLILLVKPINGAPARVLHKN